MEENKLFSKKKIDIRKISVAKLDSLIKDFFKANSGKTMSKTHLTVWLGLNTNWKRDLKNASIDNPSQNKKVALIERAFDVIKIGLIDSLLTTPEGRKIVYTTQYSTENEEQNQGVVINLVAVEDKRGVK